MGPVLIFGWLEARTAVGIATVQSFSRRPDTGVAGALRALGVGVTQVEGKGLEGPVDVVSTVIRRRFVPKVIETIEARDPDAFVTVYEARALRARLSGPVRK